MRRLFDYAKKCQALPGAFGGGGGGGGGGATTACLDPQLLSPSDEASLVMMSQHCSAGGGASSATAEGSSTLAADPHYHCGPATLALYLVTHGPLLCAVGLAALVGPAVIMIKYRKRMEAAAARQHHHKGPPPAGASSFSSPSASGDWEDAWGGREEEQEGATAARLLPPPLATLGVRIPVALSALLCRFTALLDSAADSISEALALRVVCLPVGGYYFLYTIVSRFADAKVRSTCGLRRATFPFSATKASLQCLPAPFI